MRNKVTGSISNRIDLLNEILEVYQYCFCLQKKSRLLQKRELVRTSYLQLITYNL